MSAFTPLSEAKRTLNECLGVRENRSLSAAGYLEECLPRAEYWDAPVEGQTEVPTVAQVIEFLAKA